MKGFSAVIILVLFIIAVGLALVFTRRLSLRGQELTVEAAHLEQQALTLHNEAARLRAMPGMLNAAERNARADTLEIQVAELQNEAAFLRQTRAIPIRQRAEEYVRRAQALADSANRIRADLLTRQDSLASWQQGLIARLEQDSRELLDRAQLLGTSTQDRAALYSSCVLIYGQGTHTCEQLRGAGPAGTPQMYKQP